MPVNPLGYALDLVGNNPANYITNEIHTFTVGEARVFVPSGGPFYRIDFEIRNNVTNAILVPNVDYKIVHPVVQAVLMSGKNVNAGIYVHNTNISSVRINYRIIGGNFADTADNIRQLFLNNPPTNPTLIPWDHVFGAPPQMPPVEHLHDMMDTYGYGNLISVLEQLRVAVLSGDGPAFDAIYRYIELMLNNADYVTENEVLALINNDSSSQVKVYADYAALRAETAFTNNSDLLYFAIGKNNRYDGKGRCFVWDISSTTDDDNDIVVKPTIIVTNGNGPGRLHSVLNVERDLRNSLATLGRKIDEDGNILTDLQATFPLETVDLDTVINSGVYWVKPDCTNKPAGNTQGHLFVEKNDIYVVQRFISTVQDDRNMVGEGDTNITVPTAHVFNRIGRLVSGNYVWENWRCLIDKYTLNYLLKTLGRKVEDDFTINTNISSFITPLTGSTNLNDIVKPGIYPLMADADNSTPHSNWPLGVYRGIMIVESTYLGGVSTELHTFQEIITSYDNDEQGDPVGQNPFLDGTIKPTVYRRIRENNSWTSWYKTLDTQDAKRHGLTTTGIAANNTVPALTSGNPTDLDSYTMPGKYWVGTGIVNSAFEWGLLEVELIGGTATEAGEVLQTMRSPLINGKYCQRMRYWDTLFNQHTWTNWITLAKQNGDYTQYFEADYPTLGATPFHVINGAKLATEFAALWTTLKRYGIEEAVVNNYVGNTVNLNTITTPGTYWFSDNQTNRPFDYGILEVLLIGGTIASPNEIHQRAYWDGREAIRVRHYGGNWQPWYYIKTKDLATEQNLSGVGLNGVTLPGDYYYTITTNNRPSNYGLVTVRRENEDIVYQEAHSSDNNKYIRYRDGIGTWTPWARLLSTNDISGIQTFEIVIEGFSSGNGERWFTYNVLPNDIAVEVRLVSPGGGGGGGGGTDNNGNEDYGGGGGGGGGAGVMVLVQMHGLTTGSQIEVRIGATSYGGLGGGIGGHGANGTEGGSCHLRVYENLSGYGKTLDVFVPGGRGGSGGRAGGINSCTFGGGGGAAPDITINTQGFFSVTRYIGQGGGNGSCAGGTGGTGGGGGFIKQQAFGYYGNASGGGGGSLGGNGGHGESGYIIPQTRPYNFGRGGGGGGGGNAGQASGGNGGGGGWGGAVFRITRLGS